MECVWYMAVSGMCEVYMSMVVCEGVYGVWCVYMSVSMCICVCVCGYVCVECEWCVCGVL